MRQRVSGTYLGCHSSDSWRHEPTLTNSRLAAIPEVHWATHEHWSFVPRCWLLGLGDRERSRGRLVLGEVRCWRMRVVQLAERTTPAVAGGSGHSALTDVGAR